MDKELISGIKIKPLDIIQNDKGNIFHYIRSDESSFKGFGECYLSEIFPQKIKGWKFHKLQTQNLIVPLGIVKFVLYDTRIDSKTKNNIQEVILGHPDNFQRLTIPFGIWYSFKCVSKDKGLLINFTDFPHDSNESEHQDLYDNNIPFFWK